MANSAGSIVLLGAGFDARPLRLAAPARQYLPVDSGGVLRMRHELFPPLAALLPPHGVHKPSGRVLFTPTKEWRAVPDGAICPAGLEFQVNLETGANYARLAPASIPEDAAAAAE